MLGLDQTMSRKDIDEKLVNLLERLARQDKDEFARVINWMIDRQATFRDEQSHESYQARLKKK